MGVKLSHQQNAALLYPNLSARVNNHTPPNDSVEAVKKPTKIVLLGTGEGLFLLFILSDILLYIN